MSIRFRVSGKFAPVTWRVVVGTLAISLALTLLAAVVINQSPAASAQSSNDPVLSAIMGVGPKLPALPCRPNGGKFTSFNLTVADGSNQPGIYRCNGNAWAGPALNSTGSGSTVKKVISASASLDFTALAANTCEDFTVTATGAAVGDTVALGVPHTVAGADARTSYTGWVSATNTVTVRRCNPTAATAADPAAASVRVTVIQF
jgi:hypothetical protein